VIKGILLFLTILTSWTFAFAEAAPTGITIGFLPGGDREAVKRGSFEIAKALQDELHIPVTVFLPKNYSGLIEAMKTKKVDFAFFSALAYVEAENVAGAKVLLKKTWSEEPFYYSVLLSRKDSKIQNLKSLKGKKFAFVDEKSTSGYLYPQVLFKKQNIQIGEKKFSGSHSQSVAWLDQGEADAIAVFSNDKLAKNSAYTRYSKQPTPEKKIRVLWVSEPIPNDPFCVRQDFYDQHPKLTHNLMFALIDVVAKLKSNKDVTETVGAQDLTPATQKQYDPVREMVKELDLHP
jgi:phosphonate transport system substrate-binding protein